MAMRLKKDAIGQAIKRSYKGGRGKACPVATMDVHVNLKNRNHAIEDYGYGPLNPQEPSKKFWDAKAKMWGVTPDEAKKSRCGNCAAFIKTKEMLNCISKGMESGDEPHTDYSYDVIEASNLGYCELFHFKCAGSRTCDAWIVGGPIV
jgi:hypothetical protein